MKNMRIVNLSYNIEISPYICLVSWLCWGSVFKRNRPKYGLGIKAQLYW